MIEQIDNAVTFFAHYVASKVGATGLTVTIDVWEVQKDGTAAEIVTAGSATEIGDGLYRYVLASVSVDVEGEYVAVFKTTDTSVDQQHLPAVWSVQRAGVEALDAAVTTRATPAQVNAEADTALADYDGPTKTELDAAETVITNAIGGLNNLDAAAVETAAGAALAATDGKVDDILEDTDITIPALIAAIGSPDTSAVVAGIMASAIETGMTFKEAIRLIAATTGGRVSGAGTGSNTFRSAVANDKNRVIATVDGSGNRTAITYNLGD
jgi:hypothetical protein